MKNYRVLEAVAIGDALGAPFEQPRKQEDKELDKLIFTLRDYPTVFSSNDRLGLRPGHWTDDTLLNLAQNNVSDMIDVFVANYLRKAVKDTTLNSIAYVLPNLGWGSVISKALLTGKVDKDSLSVGCLMRAPALFYHIDSKTTNDILLNMCVINASITHKHVAHALFMYWYVRLLRHYLYDKNEISLYHIKKIMQDTTSKAYCKKHKIKYHTTTYAKIENIVEGGLKMNQVSITNTVEEMFLEVIGCVLHDYSPKQCLTLCGDTDTRLALFLPLKLRDTLVINMMNTLRRRLAFADYIVGQDLRYSNGDI